MLNRIVIFNHDDNLFVYDPGPLTCPDPKGVCSTVVRSGRQEGSTDCRGQYVKGREILEKSFRNGQDTLMNHDESPSFLPRGRS